MTKLLLTILTIFIVFMWWIKPEGGYEHQKTPITKVLTESNKQAVRLIRLRGFKCDSVSGTSVSAFSGEYSVWCNDYRYHYTISDQGGRFIVEVN